MIIKKPADISPSEITDPSFYANRRQFLRGGAALALAAGLGACESSDAQAAGTKLPDVQKWPGSTTETPTSYQDVTHYNNFYEFSTSKEGPAELAKNFTTRPWTVSVAGACEKPRTFDIDDLIKRHSLQERIYRLRCVEAWSMVIPWVGFPFSALLNEVKPTSNAKYVAFQTVFDPKQMPGQRPALFGTGIEFPYVEGLRMDEAMHPLTLLTVGLYGRVLPNQNGAPVRIVVPWKYGFKSIKSIVKITLVETQPPTTWSKAAPDEYGFYANVNPHVPHPRWSQARERRIGEFFKRPTLMFNGYGDQVAHLYRGMNLHKYF